MTDNQSKSAIELRHLPPLIHKNKQKFFRLHLSMRIMIMCVNYDHAYEL